jgi:hypothetical protein
MGDIHADTSKVNPKPHPTPTPTPKICGVGGLTIMHKRA